MPGSSGEIEALIRRGRKIEAIKRLRASTGLDLRQAKEEVDRIETRLSGWAPTSDSSSAAAAPSQALLAEVKTLVLQGRKIEAIRQLRQGAGMGLVEAKRLSEALSREERRGHLSRAFLVWLLIAAAETVHGMLRSLLLVPALGDLRARQIGVVSGSLIILVIACCSIGWIGARGSRQLLGVGLLWVVLMAGFEVLLGRLLGSSWLRIASEFNPGQGGFLLAGMVILAMSPFIAAAMRSRA